MPSAWAHRQITGPALRAGGGFGQVDRFRSRAPAEPWRNRPPRVIIGGVGIDLELADCAAARSRLAGCQQADTLCPHEPDCEAALYRLLARAAADRPGEDNPWEFSYRKFADINEKMELAGMGYPAKPEPWNSGEADGSGEADDAWRAQTVPGRAGIPGFKLLSNNRWLITTKEIDEALDAYNRTPDGLRAELETDPKWLAWLRWLAVARNHGGFEAE
jgi:hypothetical protein